MGTADVVSFQLSDLLTGLLAEFDLIYSVGMLSRMSDQAVALVVKRRAAAIGLEVSELAGHSLRAGLATSAAIAGKSERAIMQQTGHRSVHMVRRYIRDGSLFRDNAAAGLGF